MDEVRRRLLLNTLKVFDLGLVILSFSIATLVVANTDKNVSLAEFLSIRVKLSNCVIFVLFLVIWHALFAVCGLYRTRKLLTTEADLLNSSKAIALSTLFLGVGAIVLPIKMITLPFLAVFWAFGAILLAISRLAIRGTVNHIVRRRSYLRYMLVVGTNSRAIEFAQRILAEPERGYRILGFVDDHWSNLKEFEKSGFRLVSDYANLPEFLRRNVVDEVATYLPLRSFYERASQIAKLCDEHGIAVRFDGDIFSLKKTRHRAEDLDPQFYFTAQGSTLQWWPMATKRFVDIVLSSLLLLLFGPLFGVVALLIQLTAEGPIFYLQERVGLNKRRFLVYKFRTMIPNAEKMMDQLERLNEISGPVFKIKNDPRITPIGRILRRTSIDELPQLLNVLKGDMSLVGPRPLPVRDYEGFSEDWQRRRFSVRPGITCLWQINGRSSISFDQWMNLDLRYMDEWSLWLDFKILLMTIPAVLKGTGAV